MASEESTIPRIETRGSKKAADKQMLAKSGEGISHDSELVSVMPSTSSASTSIINREMIEMLKMMAKINIQAETACLEDNRRREIREEERQKEQRQEEKRKEKEERLEEKRKDKEEWRKEKEERRKDEEDRRQKYELGLFQTKLQSNLERHRKRAAKGVPQLPRLEDGRDIENFLQTFQDQMTMYGVEKACWSTNLLAVLADKSIAFQSRLNVADKLDFDVLAAKVVTFHGVTPDFYRTQWNEIKIAAGESHQQCAQWTQTISYNWMKTATTRADVIDMMNNREKLLDVMEPSVQTWVRQQRPKTLNTAAELADIYVMSQPKREEPRKWSR